MLQSQVPNTNQNTAMREVKFRFWDIFNKMLHYSKETGYLNSFFDKYYACAEAENGVILEQFTGLHDKNGVEIYEGDILEGNWRTIFLVYYDADFLQFRALLSNGHNREIDYYSYKNIEVIDNIHQDPELLK